MPHVLLICLAIAASISEFACSGGGCAKQERSGISEDSNGAASGGESFPIGADTLAAWCGNRFQLLNDQLYDLGAAPNSSTLVLKDVRAFMREGAFIYMTGSTERAVIDIKTETCQIVQPNASAPFLESVFERLNQGSPDSRVRVVVRRPDGRFYLHPKL